MAQPNFNIIWGCDYITEEPPIQRDFGIFSLFSWAPLKKLMSGKAIPATNNTACTIRRKQGCAGCHKSVYTIQAGHCISPRRVGLMM